MMAPSAIAPRVAVYAVGSRPPSLEPGWLTLPLLPPDAGGSRVFGDGSHATTRLCAAAVDFTCRQRAPKAVLDVGTGTGILARIARARGASFVVGTDIDPAALSCARANAALDSHPLEIELSQSTPDHWGPRFDLVVANILEAPLRTLSSAFCSALAPQATLLLSGFTRPQVPALSLVYESAGLTLVNRATLDDWVMLAFRKRPSP
jgi:ribosomal protein L11 methyltransferase